MISYRPVFRLREVPDTELPLVVRRWQRLDSESRSYAWWLGANSKHIRALINGLGWRLSRQALRSLGRPQGALTWPLGLGLLILNANGTPSDECLSWVRSIFSGIVDRNGLPRIDIGHIDLGGIAYAALRMHELTGDGRYLKLAKRFGETVLAMPGAEDGTIPYSSKNAYVLVDTVAFICPFLARLSRHTGDAIHAAIAVRQIDAMWQHGHAMAPWIQHGFRRDDLQAIGSCQWGRGLGWLILGLVDTLTELPVSPVRFALLTKTTSVFDRLICAQLSSGHFPLMLDSIDSPPDSSLTAIVAYSLARLRQAELIQDGRYDSLLTSCMAALDASTQRDGSIFDCSGEAGGLAQYSLQMGHHLWAQGPTVACDAIVGQTSL